MALASFSEDLGSPSKGSTRRTNLNQVNGNQSLSDIHVSISPGTHPSSVYTGWMLVQPRRTCAATVLGCFFHAFYHCSEGMSDLCALYKSCLTSRLKTSHIALHNMLFRPIFAALLSAAIANAQARLCPLWPPFWLAYTPQITACTTVPTDVATQEAEMQAFNSKTPAPSTSNLLDCATATILKTGIDTYRTAVLADPADGCFLIYTTTTLLDGFLVQYATLSQFVSGCGSL
ncbi:hypothetical protein C8R47DRAFT_704210 [Mycena vitilis]|nr:hypothetical protein C8R47DRAFT_704210 [Mycena vitilis]